MKIRICKYRNCDKLIEGRQNKLYCNRRCKSNDFIIHIEKQFDSWMNWDNYGIGIIMVNTMVISIMVGI